MFSGGYIGAIKTHVDTFLEFLAFEKRYSEHTIIAYRNDLYAFTDMLASQFEIDDLTQIKRRQVSSFIAYQTELGLKPRSINRKISSIQSFFEYFIREGKLELNPARNIQRPKSGTELPSVVREESISKLFNELEFDEDYIGQRDRLILNLFYACGLRREELINLTTESIDLSNGSLRILGKRNKERIVPLAPVIVDMIQEYINLRRSEFASVESYLFLTKAGKKLYPSLVYQIVKKYLSQVTSMEKRSPHVLRHTFATHLLNEGANLQSIKELLGHSSLSATQIYTHTSLDKLKDVYRKSHPRNKK